MGSAQDHVAAYYGGMLVRNVKEKPGHADHHCSG